MKILHISLPFMISTDYPYIHLLLYIIDLE